MVFVSILVHIKFQALLHRIYLRRGDCSRTPLSYSLHTYPLEDHDINKKISHMIFIAPFSLLLLLNLYIFSFKFVLSPLIYKAFKY
jgi:hypothetical protein